MKPQIKDEVIDQLLTSDQSPSDLFGSEGLLNELKKRLIQRAMDAELTTHLGYPKHGKTDQAQANSRNGHSSKTIKSGTSTVTIDVPRDRIGEYDPLLIPKHQRHFDGFDDVIVSLYSHGLSTRDIAEHLKHLYNVEVSPTLISNVTDSVLEEVRDWQSRPLKKVYPIVYFDAIVSKVRHEGKVSNRAIHLALGINHRRQKKSAGDVGLRTRRR